MNRTLILITLLGLGLLTGMVSCNESETPTESGFNRGEMLTNVVQKLIIPAFTDLGTHVAALSQRAEAFTQSPTPTTLSSLQEAWSTAYTSWQFANSFNFGPAGEQGVRRGLNEEIGTFPISIAKVENAVSGTPNFNDFNRDARGFLAVEYLIFGMGKTPTELVDEFSTQKRKDFLLGAISDIDRRVNEVLSAWNGGYSTTFVQNVGTDVGSSTSMLYNEFVKSFEAIKNFKLGLPLGRRPGQTQAEPQLVEAYYSGKSLEMLEANLVAVENIWFGRSREGQDGAGFREYLQSVEGGQALIAATEAQMTAVKSALAAVPKTSTLAEQIQQAPQPADKLHTELQKHTRFYKSDMSSILGISITFSSGDGD
nr:hypothetical protein [Cytophagales bacterium]